MPAPEAKYPAETTREDRIEKRNAQKSSAQNLETQQVETAQYVADMILELRNMVKAAKLHNVMAPLEYAYYEAFSVANQVDVPQDEIDRIRSLTKAAALTETEGT